MKKKGVALVFAGISLIIIALLLGLFFWFGSDILEQTTDLLSKYGIWILVIILAFLFRDVIKAIIMRIIR